MLDLDAIFGSDDTPAIGTAVTVPVEAAHQRVLAALDINPAVDPTDAATVWRVALDDIEGDPLFPPAMLTAMRAADVRWADDPWVDPWEAAVELPEACKRCGSLELWQSLAGDLSGMTPGKWRCVQCDPPETARRSRRLAALLRTN